MPTPARFPFGLTTDPVWGPLGQFGLPNQFDYHNYWDDFDYTPSVTGAYTKTTTGNGTVAVAAGNGGTALFTTNSSTPAAGDVASIQLPAAGFALTAGKKAFFYTRLKAPEVSNTAFLVGLIQTTTTPFTVTDGIYFLKASGATTLVGRHSASSTATSTTIPTAANPLAINTYIDLGIYLDPKGNVNFFVGSDLLSPNSTAKGPVASITPATLASANLNFTVALQSGTASSKTMTVDFAMAAVER